MERQGKVRKGNPKKDKVGKGKERIGKRGKKR